MEESDYNIHSEEDILAEMTKTNNHPLLKPPVSIRMGNQDKVNDSKQNSDEACIRYTIHGKCAAGIFCKFSHKEKDCQALWEQLRNNLDKSPFKGRSQNRQVTMVTDEASAFLLSIQTELNVTKLTFAPGVIHLTKGTKASLGKSCVICWSPTWELYFNGFL